MSAMIRCRAACLGVVLVAGCGGGEVGVPERAPAGAQSTPSTASPGGIWHAAGEPGESMSLFIAETGEMTVMQTGPAFGAGAVMVNEGDELTGSYTLHTAQTTPTAPRVGDSACDLMGTVAERVSLRIDVTCRDAEGETVSERSATLLYDAAYESGSSLAAIAGNYTLAFAAQSNILTIGDDGALFGMYDNGPACTVNGSVEVIDPQFSLLRFELTFSNCEGAQSDRYEDETMTGLGWPDPPGAPAGAIHVMLTEVIEGRFEFVSVLYEPA